MRERCNWYVHRILRADRGQGLRDEHQSGAAAVAPSSHHPASYDCCCCPQLPHRAMMPYALKALGYFLG
jgi:hypothetical protein